MARKRKQPGDEMDPTPVAFALGCLGGAGMMYVAEILYDNIRESPRPDIPGLPNWRAHMGSAFLGTVAFVITFFLLEALGRQSKLMAWRASAPWLPLIALTGLATAIHIPAYLVIPAVAIYSVWAYRRTRAVR